MSLEREKKTVPKDRIRHIDIRHELRSAYLDYAMSVIVARALPDARDGLKPVQRRILYAMYDMGLRPQSPYKKSARIVGEVLGKYHPHGDSAVYEAMARMAQDFSMRYPLVDGQGNFGSIDGDAPAAMRYTEARLSPIAMEILADIEKQTVDWTDNFDGSLQEPQVLPSRFPNLVVNGSSGIAVGMATNIPPHNLNEVINALVYILDHWDRREEIVVAPTEQTQAAENGDEELPPLRPLMDFIRGPDFPTGGQVLGRESITHAYATGRGKLTVRAVADVEEMRGGRYRIVITEIPYQVNKSSLLERIATLVRNGRLDDISDLRDESDRRGMRIVIELKRGTNPRKALNRLYKHTPLQTTFSVQLLALVDGVPRVLPLKRLLLIFLDHRLSVLIRRSQFELNQAQARAHLLEGLRIALDHLDAVVRTIRESHDVTTARARLMARFGLSEAQAQAILDMPLRRLTGLERQKLEAEYADLTARIAQLEALLVSPARQRAQIREELLALGERYGDTRRTRIRAHDDGTLEDEDLIEREDVLISITRRGYIKRVPWSVYHAQRRGGRGVIGANVGDEDQLVALISANSHDTLLLFTNRGKVYSEKVHRIPEAKRTARGTLIAGILALAPDERVTAMVNVPDFNAARYLVIVTRLGKVKRLRLEDFRRVRPSGLIAIRLQPGDELAWVHLTRGNDEIILVSEQGRGIRFHEREIRPMGRNAAGVTAIRLDGGDRVVVAEVVEPGGSLLIVTRNGYGRRTPLDAFRTQGRGGKGVLAYRVDHRTGPVADVRVVQDADEISLMSREGLILRTNVNAIPKMGRYAKGVRMMDLKPGDHLALIARLYQNGKHPAS